jgi:hypothetical protein
MTLLPQVRTMLVVLALAATACSDGAADAAGVAAPEVGPPVAGESDVSAPVAPVDPGPEVRDDDASGPRIVEGWSPYPVFADGFSPWSEGSALDVVEWLDQLLPSRAAPEGAVSIDVDVSAELEPGPCFAFHRPVEAVRVTLSDDASGQAGAAVAAQLQVVADAAAALIDEYRTPSADILAWCEQSFEREAVGFHIVEVHAEQCEQPGGPDVVCATVGALGYHLAAREFWFGETLVFDSATGARIDREQLLAPYDPARLADLFATIRAAVDIEVPHLAEQGVVAADLDLDPLSADADVVPTVDGLRWRWSPYRHVTGSIDVIVPWDELEAVVVR